MILLQSTLLFCLLSTGVSVQGQLWKEYVDSAGKNQKEKRLEVAEEYFLKAITELSKDSSGTITMAQVSHNLGDLYINLGKYDKAGLCMDSALKIREKKKGRVSTEYAESCHGLGIVYYYLRDFVQVEKYWSEEKKVLESLPDTASLKYAKLCYNLGLLYTVLQEPEKVKSNFLQAKTVQEKVNGKYNNEYILFCNKLAFLYWESELKIKARDLFEEVRFLRKELTGQENTEYIIASLNLSSIYIELDQFEKAELVCSEALKMAERVVGKEHQIYGRCCIQLGVINVEMGKYSKVEPLYTVGRRIWAKVYGTNSAEYAEACNNFGVYYENMGQFDLAESAHTEALKIKEKLFGKKSPEYAVTCSNLALFYRSIGQYNRGEDFAQQAVEIVKSLGKERTLLYARYANTLAGLYRAMGEIQKSEEMFLQILAIKENVVGKEHSSYAITSNDLANLYLDINQFEKAETLYLATKQVREKIFGRNIGGYANICENLGVVYTKMNKYDKAESFYKEAQVIYKNMFGSVHASYSRICGNLADLYRNMNRIQEARQYYTEALSSFIVQTNKLFQFTSENEKHLFKRKMNDIEQHFYSFIFSSMPGDSLGIAYDFSLINRSLILSSLAQLRQSVFSSNDSSLKNMYENWISAREELSFLYSKSLDERGDRQAEIEKRAELLEKEINKISTRSVPSLKEGIGWQQIKESLKSDEAIIDFVEFEYYDGKRLTDSVYYIAHVITKNSHSPELVKLFEKRTLDSLLGLKKTIPGRQKINLLYADKTPAALASNALFELIWKPLEKRLDRIKTVYFAAAGVLHKIAFAALPVNDQEVLIDKYKLVQLNTTASLASRLSSRLSDTDRIILYGGVQYNADSIKIREAVAFSGTGDWGTSSLPQDLDRDAVGEFNYLPGTQLEIEAITKLAITGKYSVSSL